MGDSLRIVASVLVAGSMACGSVPTDPDAGDGDAAAQSDAPGSSFALTVTVAGEGGGVVTSVPAGIDCGAECSASFPVDTQVTLTATPGDDSTFESWSGACTGTGTCEVTITEATSVTATFATAEYTLTVTASGIGSGTVSSDVGGIDCGKTCSATLEHGTVVTLTATPDAGSTLETWTGDCAGAGDCVITMDADKTVDAAFGTPSCVDNPQWTPVTCTTTDWVWSRDRTMATTLQDANSLQLLASGCNHGSPQPELGTGMCSLDGTGWVSTATFTMADCNTLWYHLGGSFTGNCSGHDGDTYRHLVLGIDDCFAY